MFNVGANRFCSCHSVDRTEETGQYQSHPKVYVGFFKHSNFANKDDHLQTMDMLAPNDEYRSDDWFYMPTLEDLHPGSEIGRSIPFAVGT